VWVLGWEDPLHLIADLTLVAIMAQGVTKLKAKGSARVTKKRQNPKPAAPKIIKPKKATAKQAAKLSKVQQGQLAASTEKLIAARVGHLELVKGSRREIEKNEKQEKKKSK
jgi:hypothetical protein